ncbi:hypothetical protein RRG08_003890 [Elysia crispata]|uniref:Uncharacterized protein n=1 Tax=Elysia crispata TaxID=231223 RepID=A0AAE0ZDX3_9GAST|nr:hypothetical protein RRG08_003890 [Elysia crispata]
MIETQECPCVFDQATKTECLTPAELAKRHDLAQARSSHTSVRHHEVAEVGYLTLFACPAVRDTGCNGLK